jgi:hypothetical protein
MQTKIVYTPNKSVNYKGTPSEFCVQTYLTTIHLGLQKIVSGGQTGNIDGAEFKRELIKNSRVNNLGIL